MFVVIANFPEELPKTLSLLQQSRSCASASPRLVEVRRCLQTFLRRHFYGMRLVWCNVSSRILVFTGVLADPIGASLLEMQLRCMNQKVRKASHMAMAKLRGNHIYAIFYVCIYVCSVFLIFVFIVYFRFVYIYLLFVTLINLFLFVCMYIYVYVCGICSICFYLSSIIIFIYVFICLLFDLLKIKI